jgi:HemY protein
MRLLVYILILCLTVWAGFFLHKNPGNLELTYKDLIIVMPLWLPILAGIALLFLLNLVFSLFSSISRTYHRFREWLIGSSMRSVIQNANEARTALVEGDWSHAESKMLKAAKNSDTPLHYYLAAAKAAQELGSLDRRDGYLHQALRVTPDAKVVVLITQAELQFEQGQYEYCVATIQELQKLSPNNRQVLKLAASVFAATGAWDDMVSLLPQLNKYAILPNEDFVALEIKTYTYVMRNIAKKSGKQGLEAYWDDQIPRNVRQYVEIVETYAQLLLSMQAYNEVEQVVRNHLKKQWDVKLVKLYGLVLGPDVSKQISTAETWLKTHQDDPALLLTLARLCIAQKLWGKARNYLDASLAIEANPDAYAELGRLLGFLGEQQKALECYKKGLLEFADILPLEQVAKT